MGIRKGIFIGAAALSIMACTACGSSEGNVSGTNGVETSTGVESGMIEQPQVMYDGYIYYYNATGRDEDLPEGYESVGAIEKVDSKDYHAEVPSQGQVSASVHRRNCLLLLKALYQDRFHSLRNH